MCWFFIDTWQRIVSAGSVGVWTGQGSTAFLQPHTQVHQEHQASKKHDQTWNNPKCNTEKTAQQKNKKKIMGKL